MADLIMLARQWSEIEKNIVYNSVRLGKRRLGYGHFRHLWEKYALILYQFILGKCINYIKNK